MEIQGKPAQDALLVPIPGTDGGGSEGLEGGWEGVLQPL